MKINRKCHVRKKGPGKGKPRRNPGRWKNLGKGVKVRKINKTTSEVKTPYTKNPIRIQITEVRPKKRKR